MVHEMQVVFVITLLLFKNGLSEEMFSYFEGKIFGQTSSGFSIAQESISTSCRFCAMSCFLKTLCMAADFDSSLRMCTLYSNINGTTSDNGESFSIARRNFGECKCDLFSHSTSLPLISSNNQLTID